MPENDLELVGFGWFTKNKGAFIVRFGNGDGNNFKLDDTGCIIFTRDLDLLKEGKLTKRDGTTRKSVAVYKERPYKRD